MVKITFPRPEICTRASRCIRFSFRASKTGTPVALKSDPGSDDVEERNWFLEPPFENANVQLYRSPNKSAFLATGHESLPEKDAFQKLNWGLSGASS